MMLCVLPLALIAPSRQYDSEGQSRIDITSLALTLLYDLGSTLLHGLKHDEFRESFDRKFWSTPHQTVLASTHQQA
jgi:hypothetical protein